MQNVTDPKMSIDSFSITDVCSITFEQRVPARDVRACQSEVISSRNVTAIKLRCFVPRPRRAMRPMPKRRAWTAFKPGFKNGISESAVRSGPRISKTGSFAHRAVSEFQRTQLRFTHTQPVCPSHNSRHRRSTSTRTALLAIMSMIVTCLFRSTSLLT